MSLGRLGTGRRGGCASDDLSQFKFNAELLSAALKAEATTTTRPQKQSVV